MSNRAARHMASCEHEITAVMYARGFEYGICRDRACMDQAADTIWTYTGREAALRLLPPKPDPDQPPGVSPLTKLSVNSALVVVCWMLLALVVWAVTRLL